jgi:glycogen debranching enzyme
MPEPYVQVTRGSVLIAEPDGQVRPADPGAFAVARAAGLHVRDCRVVSTWVLRVDGVEPVLAGGTQDTTGRHCALLPRTARNESPDVWLVRDQDLLADGLVDQIDVRNLAADAGTVRLTLDVAGDFADQFTLRGDGRAYPTRPEPSADVEGGVLRLRYRNAIGGTTFERTVEVTASPVPAVAAGECGHVLTWDLLVPGHGETRVTIRARECSPAPTRPVTGWKVAARPDERVGQSSPLSMAGLARQAAWLREVSVRDLDGLIMPSPHASDADVPAAGPPWFMILAARDGILTSLLAEGTHPRLLPGVLTALARTQGRTVDPRLGEQPGKMVHELRSGELADLGVVPYSRYFGSVDATPLFLLALDRLAERGTVADRDLLRLLEPAARAAVGWLHGDGGLDESGFVVYRPDPTGLLNQGWKDSFDAVVFADGRVAEGPIALAEVQGYAWAGLRAAARCARDVWGAPDWAADLEREAAALRERFHDRFWMAGPRFPALALDGSGAQVDALASNAGHTLWTGLLDPDHARDVTERLAGDEFFTGWSVRTVARSEGVYEPLSYHRGSCWPHDTALAMRGMERYGHVEPARRLAAGIVRAGVAFDGRLPELFAGFGRDEFPTPVRYAYAARPQAWSAAAGIAAAGLVG